MEDYVWKIGEYDTRSDGNDEALDELLKVGMGKVSAPDDQKQAVKDAVAEKIKDIFATKQSAERAFMSFVDLRQRGGETEELWELILGDKLNDHSRHEICSALASVTTNTTVAEFEKALEMTHDPVMDSKKTKHGNYVVTQLTCSDALKEIMGTRTKPPLQAVRRFDENPRTRWKKSARARSTTARRPSVSACVSPGSATARPTRPKLRPINFFQKDVVDDAPMKRRLEKCDRTFASPLQRALAKTFLGTPINHHALQAFIDADCVFPFQRKGGCAPFGPLFSLVFLFRLARVFRVFERVRFDVGS